MAKILDVVLPIQGVESVVNASSAIVRNMTSRGPALRPDLSQMTQFRRMTTAIMRAFTTKPPLLASRLTETYTRPATTAIPKPLDEPPTTTQGLKVFSLDFIDTKEFQERMADIIAGRDSRQSTTVAATESPADTLDIRSHLGLLIPVAIFIVFLLFVVFCVLWQVLHNRLPTKQQSKTALSTFYRSQVGWEGARSSTRSTTPLKMHTIVHNQREFFPRLDRISESPEDRLKGGSVLNEMPFSPDSSLASILSQLEQELATVVAGNASLGISPYVPPPPPNYYSDMSQSYPNLPVTAQAPFSPYHLAWMTPNQGQPPRGGEQFPLTSAGPPSRALPRCHPNRSLNESGLDGMPVMNIGKSPYHPNNNTPTNGSENDSCVLPPNVYVNHISSMSCTADLNNNSSLKDSHSASEPELVHSGITPRLLEYSRSSSVGCGVGTGTPSTECILSGPSNLGSWRYNRLYVNPSVGPQSPLYPYPGADIHAMHNSSITAMVGSGNNTGIQPMSELYNNASCSVPELVGRPAHSCSLYQADLAAYLQYELSRYSPAPPYEPPPHHSTTTVTRTLVNQSSLHGSSNNASTCGQLDSLETSASESTITGQVSSNTSGYTAGPSHSTSVTGVVTGLMPPGPPSNNSSLMSNSISSILPMNSGATQNTPNASFADSFYNKGMSSEESQQDTSSCQQKTSRSESTESTMTSSLCDQGSANHSSSEATASSTTNQSQHTTAPESVSLQWDSFSEVAVSGAGTSLSGNQGSRDNSASSNSNQKSSTEGATSSQASSMEAPPGETRCESRASALYEWDAFPFYRRGTGQWSRRHSIQPGHTGPPPPRPLQQRPPGGGYPVLASTQYWV